MKRCPFWSSKEKVIKCNNECSMHEDLNNGEECVFSEYLQDIDLKFNDIIENDNFEKVLFY